MMSKWVFLSIFLSLLYLQDSSAQNINSNDQLHGKRAKEMCKEYSQDAIKNNLTCPINDPSELAIGGYDVQREEYPHMIQIGYKEENDTNWLCSGSIISKNFIITVAHCMMQISTGRKPELVRAGVTDQTDLYQAQIRKIEEIIVHPDFKLPVKYNDVALIKVDKDFNFNDYVRPACLYIEDKHLETKKAIQTGWGQTDISQATGRKIMLKIYLNFVTADVCNDTFNKDGYTSLPMGIIEDKLVCAGVNDEDVKRGCQEESGGPLQIIQDNTEDVQCMYGLVGVSSFGVAPCGIADDLPSAYTRLSYYIKWIEDLVWK